MRKKSRRLINGKNTMTVSDINQLKGHRGSAIHGIFITAGRAETAVTTERNKLKISAVETAIHGTTKEGSPQLIILSIFSISVDLG